MGHVWNDETTEIVRCNWGEKNPAQIAAIVNNYLKKGALNAGKKSWGITSPRGGGVVWKAAELGLITTEERDLWIAKKEQRKRKERSKINKLVRQLIIERDGGQCLCCGATDNLQVDHIVPIFMGGTSETDNLQTLCQKCNLQKGINSTDYYHCASCGAAADPLGKIATFSLWSDGTQTVDIKPACKQCCVDHETKSIRISKSGNIKRKKPRPTRAFNRS